MVLPDQVPDPGLELWPECLPAVEVFMACRTQWRVAGMDGMRTGLDYAAVEAVMRMRRVRGKADCLSDVMVIEHAVLERWQEQRA